MHIDQVMVPAAPVLSRIPAIYARPENHPRTALDQGAASAWPWEAVSVTEVLNGVGRYSGGIAFGEAAVCFRSD